MNDSSMRRLEIRLSPEEKRTWTACAKKRGLTLSDWIRVSLNMTATASRKSEQPERSVDKQTEH